MCYRLLRPLFTTALFLLVSACSSLPPTTAAVERVDGHIGGFDIKYNVSVISDKPPASVFGKQIDRQSHADGAAALSVQVDSGKRFVGNLSAMSSVGIARIKLQYHSEGVFRDNLPAMNAFSSKLYVTAIAPRTHSVKVDYEKKQVVFSNYGNDLVQDLSQDRVLDLVSAILYLRAGLQQGAIAHTPNRFTLPISRAQPNPKRLGFC